MYLAGSGAAAQFAAEQTQKSRKYLAEGKERSIQLLQQAIRALEDNIANRGPDKTLSAPPASPPVGPEIFIVQPREAVARFLESLHLKPIILHEQANQGRTIIEKFEAHANVGFAIILLTPDDVGGSVAGQQQARARQNVILELGYFTGKLTRARVCAIKIGEIELPSDILGIVWTEFDQGGAWKVALAKELRAAGYEIDWNKVIG